MSDLRLHCVGDVYAAAASLDAFAAEPTFGLGKLAAACNVLQRADVRFANLEAPLLEHGRALYSTGVRLRSPPALVDVLRRLGVEVVTLANNHMLDFGVSGLRSTLAHLRRAGIASVGAGADLDRARRPVFHDVRGRRIAFLGVCDDQGGGAGPGRPGVCLINPRHLVPCVRRLRRQADYIVVGVHTGLEFYPCPEPWFLDLATRLIDAGAAVVAGHHPHVPHGVLRHGKGLVACSLGDFLFDLPRAADDMTERQRRFNALHPVLEVDLAGGGVADHRVFWLTRDFAGRYREAEAAADFDPREEFAELCRLLQDPDRHERLARDMYRTELYQVLYTVYGALYAALRRRQPGMLRGMPWWLATYRREPKRRFVRHGLAAAARWALDRLRG
jgi:hypothetical protein